jgi:polysaccharide biosynthesis transport protein
MKQSMIQVHDEWSTVPTAVPSSDGSRSADGRAFLSDVRGRLRRRRGLVATTTVVLMAAWTGIILTIPKSYQATSTVIVEQRRPAVVRMDNDVTNAPFGTDTMATEVEIIGSREILGSVVDELKLTADPEFNPSHEPGLRTTIADQVFDLLAALGLYHPERELSVDRSSRERNAAIDRVLARLSISPVGLSRVVRITVTSSRPETAAAIVNTIARDYRASHVARAAQATREAHDWIDQRLDELRGRAARSAVALQGFRSEHGFIKGKDATVVQEQITQVSSELLRVRVQRVAVEAAVEQMRTSGIPDGELVANVQDFEVLGRLREQASQVSARYAEITRRYGVDSPAAEPIRAQLADMNRSIANERDRLRQTLLSRLAVATKSEAMLGTILDELKERAERMDAGMVPMLVLEREANADQDLYTSFVTRSRQTDAYVNFASADARILSDAAVPTAPHFPNLKLLLPAGLVLSFGLAVLLALAREHARPSLLSMGDVERSIGVAPLGLLPLVPAGDEKTGRIFSDAVSLILARILLADGGTKPRSILVTSALPGEGKTTTSIALARAAGAQGLKVLLVDADLRLGSLSSLAGSQSPGATLAGLLQKNTAMTDEPIHEHPDWGISVLPRGEAPEMPNHLLGSGAWEALLRQLMTQYDLVVIDSPAVLIGADSWLLARHAEATLVLSRWRSTPLNAVAFAINQMVTARARLAGVVLTLVSTRDFASAGRSESFIYSPALRRYYDVGARRTEHAG